MIAEVIATYGRHLLLRDATGTQYRARPLGRKLEIVCGDRVDCEFQGEELLVTRTLPRDTFLRRSTVKGRAEPLAANLTQLAVVLAPVPSPDLFLVDRYLCAAQCAGLSALVVLNKADLADAPEVEQSLAPLQALGYPLLSLSAEQAAQPDAPAAALAALAARLQGHTTIFVGQSGVGKSSLTRLLTSEDTGIAVGELVREEEGRHTTTASRLYDGVDGGRIMDSPGVRDFAPAIDDLEVRTLGFREVAQLAPSCRFLDCQHLAEPGCAVRGGIESGEVDARRYESYRRLRRLWDQLWEQRPQRERAARPR